MGEGLEEMREGLEEMGRRSRRNEEEGLEEMKCDKTDRFKYK